MVWPICLDMLSAVSKSFIRYPTIDDQEYWEHKKSSTIEGLLAKFQNTLSGIDYGDWYRTHFLAKSKIRANFIEPWVARLEYNDGQRKEVETVAISKALEKTLIRQFVIGPQDCGLTTASFITAKWVVEQFESFQAVPVYINTNGITLNKASLTREAVKTCPIRFSHLEMETLLQQGGIVFLIDQIKLPEVQNFNLLVEILDKYFPKCRSIIFCCVDGGASWQGSDGELRFNPIQDVVFEMQELNSDRIKNLIQAHHPGMQTDQVDVLLNKVITSFIQMDEPVFPSSVAVLLETLQQIPNFRPLNRVKLLDRYVECLLGRFELEDVEEGIFNSSDKANFLSFVAGKLLTDRRIGLSDENWKDIYLEYSESKLLDLPGSLLSEFSQKGILVLKNGFITFRADYLFTYFVAKEMNQNSTLFDHITADDTFFAYHRELVFYGELEGVDNLKLLDATNQRLCELEEKIHEAYLRNGIDFDQEWNRMVSEDPDEEKDNSLMNSVKEISEQYPTDKTISAAQNRDLQSVNRGRGISKRTQIKELESRWFIAIKTYFQLIKHCTNLNAGDKLRHLGKAAESSELFIKSLATKRGIIAVQPTYFYSGIIYINPLAAINPERSIKEFKYMVPNSFSKILNNLIINPLLAPAFRKLLEEESEIVQFLARNLLLEMPNPVNSRMFVNSLLNSEEPILQTCSLYRLKDRYLGYSITNEMREFYKGIIDKISQDKKFLPLLGKEKLEKKRNLTDLRRNLSGNKKII